MSQSKYNRQLSRTLAEGWRLRDKYYQRSFVHPIYISIDLVASLVVLIVSLLVHKWRELMNVFLFVYNIYIFDYSNGCVGQPSISMSRSTIS